MKTIVIVSVHSHTNNIFSSNDYDGYKQFNSLEEANKFIESNNLIQKEIYQDEELQINIIYLKPLEHNKRRAEIEELFIEGFSEDVIKYWDKQEDLKNQERRKQGYVEHKKFKELTPEDYKGSLSENLLTDIIIDYISSNVVYGYIGHSARKHTHDKIINDIIENTVITLDEQEINKWDIISAWLISTDARHYMDQMKNVEDDEFKNKFIHNLGDIMRYGFVYSLDEHKGTRGSTINLLDKYKNRIKVGYQGFIRL